MGTSETGLLSRDAFRDAVFARDQHRCVFCKNAAADAHHIIERRLWPDGGYYLDNGASVCSDHHLRCETTEITVEAVREASGITKIIVPPHLYPDQPYDKWGNPVLPYGQRMRGELFFDASVQKALVQGRVLDCFTHLVKYPRTHHLPWSESVNDDDRLMPSLHGLIGRRVIATRKMDGENSNLYADDMHARSVDSRHHPSRSWVKGFWAGIAGDIPAGWRVCGENLYAEHSIRYTDLPTYFMGFSVWDERNVCLSWDQTQEWFALLGVTSVPVLYDGIFDEKALRSLWADGDWQHHEGYVVRTADAIPYGEFRHKCGKFVRRGHVQTQKHWMHGQPVKPNLLAKEAR
jgi:hypothetical protein